jgi:transposase
MAEYAAFVGFNWADKKHDICLVDSATGKKEFSVIKHSPQAIQEWATNLQKRFGGRTVAVALEQSRGSLFFALLKYGFLVLYPINPSTLARYREAFSPSRAKDAPTHADYAVELLIHHRDRLKAWMHDDDKTRTLQYLVEHRRRVVSDRTRVSNRMTALLKLYFPQVLEWFPDIRTGMVCDFLLKWPTLEEVKKARRATLEKFFRHHNSARKEALAERLKAIEESQPLTEDEAVISSSVVMMKTLARQMKQAICAIKEFDQQIAQLCASYDDYQLLASLPGSGSVYSSRLLAAFGTDRNRFESAEEVARLSGIAPVIERSGQSSWIRWRYFCPKFMRQSFQEYAGESVKHSLWARAYYKMQRGRARAIKQRSEHWLSSGYI